MSSASNATGHTATVESLAEVFRCFICMEKLRDARLCPHCSKLCCYPCIRRWLTDQRQQCPHCRSPLRLHDFVNCRWAEEVTSQLDNLKTNEISKQKREEKDKCDIHREKLSVFCSSCSQCICHQCALFNGSHAGHNFLPLDEVYQANMSTVNEHIGQLKRRHVELICLIEDVERNVESVKNAKEERMRETQSAIQIIQAKLNEQLKVKLDALNEQRQQFVREIESIEDVLRNIEHRVSTSGKAEVIGKQQDFLNTIQMIYRKPMTSFVTTPIPCDFPSEIVPQYDSSTFVISNFSILRHNVDPIYSQPLHINGLTWRLKVYPDGNGTVRGTYLSVFLELTNGLNEPSKYEYRVEMIHQLSKDSSKNVVREFASDFEVGECWGYNRFFLLDNLINEGFLDTDNDILILRFQVRPPNYQQKCRDQQWCLSHLENENQHLHNEIKLLREKVQFLLSNKRRGPTSTEKTEQNEIMSSHAITENQVNHQTEENKVKISTSVRNTEQNEDDSDDIDEDENDDEQTSLESDGSCQIDSEELLSDDDDDENDIDAENGLADNEVEQIPSFDLNTINISGQSTPIEQNLHQHFSLVVPSSNVRPNEMYVITVHDLERNGTRLAASETSALAADIDHAMQQTIDDWRKEILPGNNGNSTNDDYLLADILQRSENNEHNSFRQNLSNLPLFCPNQTESNNDNQTPTVAASVIHTYYPHFSTGLNGSMLLHSPIHRSVSPTDLSPQQRTRHRHHHHHHRHSTTPRRVQGSANISSSDISNTENNSKDT